VHDHTVNVFHLGLNKRDYRVRVHSDLVLKKVEIFLKSSEKLHRAVIIRTVISSLRACVVSESSLDSHLLLSSLDRASVFGNSQLRELFNALFVLYETISIIQNGSSSRCHVHACEYTYFVKVLRPNVTSKISIKFVFRELSLAENFKHDHKSMFFSASCCRYFNADRKSLSLIRSEVISILCDTVQDGGLIGSILTVLSSLALVKAMVSS